MKTKILLALLLGIILGGAGVWQYTMVHPRRWDSESRFKFMLRQFNHRLDLNKDQQKQVADILQEKRKKIEAIRAEMKPKCQAIRQETRTEIRKILTPDQQKKYDILDVELAARWRRK